MRDQIRLSCSQCQRNNYYTTKNKRTTTQKIELRKYDPVVKKHVVFTEMKMPNPKQK